MSNRWSRPESRKGRARAPADTPPGVGEVAGPQEVPNAIPLTLGGAGAAVVFFCLPTKSSHPGTSPGTSG